MSHTATGTFEVDLQPLPAAAASAGAEAGKQLGRMSIAKRIHGDLVATTVGEMLTAMTDVQGSAGYVAIERVTGTLQGRSGSFVLQHTGTMDRGAQQLSITVVPDSGTGALVGLTGSFRIEIAEGQHRYVFDYRLPGP